MGDRSKRRETRNPILALAEAREILALPLDAPITRRHLGRLLRAMAKQSFENAEKAWRKGKPPVAAYHRASSTVIKHIAHVIDPRSQKALDEMREALDQVDKEAA